MRIHSLVAFVLLALTSWSPIVRADEVSEVPEGLRGFSGLLVGSLISKDTEKGELVMLVRRVKRVWRGNKAENPRAAIERRLAIDGISGKFLDVLLVLKPEDTFEIEAKHTRGNRLQFLGEGFKKVAASEAKPRENEKDGGLRGLQGFSGMVIGQLLKKDVERGSLTLKVKRVKRVWRNNKAENPYSLVGKTIDVKGVSGKFLDALLVIKVEQDIEMELKHNRGEVFDFPGEWLRRAPVEEAKPTVGLDGYRGFNGQVRGVVKDRAKNLLAFHVARVTRVWPKVNKAKNPEAILKQIIKVSPQNERHGKFIATLEEGAEVTLNIKHAEGDRFVITELNRDQRELAGDSPEPNPEGDDKRPPLQGFRAAVIGKFLEADTEKGILVLKVEKVHRVFKNNKAREPQAAVGKTMVIEGISGKFLDLLLVAKERERFEVAVFNLRGETFTFPGELLRKARDDQ